MENYEKLFHQNFFLAYCVCADPSYDHYVSGKYITIANKSILLPNPGTSISPTQISEHAIGHQNIVGVVSGAHVYPRNGCT